MLIFIVKVIGLLVSGYGLLYFFHKRLELIPNKMKPNKDKD